MEKINKQLEEQVLDNYDPRTYRDYLKLGDMNTAHYLMLSELIDNSISSMDNNMIDGEWARELEISITLNLATEYKNKVDLFSIPVFENDYIIVEDNAFGMDAKTLKYALKLNNVNTTTSSRMNTHGRGLKQSAFYFGTDLVVETNDGNESNKIALELSKQPKGLDSKIKFIIEPSNKKEIGTIVKIGKIIAAHRITPVKWEQIKMALWERYKKLITGTMGKKMTINISINLSGTYKEEDEKIKGSHLQIAKIADIVEKENIDKLINSVEEKVNKQMKNETVDLSNETIKRAFEEIKKIFLSAKTDINKKFEYELVLPFNDQPTPVKFWVWAKNGGGSKLKITPFKGLSVYEGDRAILHGPNSQNGPSTYHEWHGTTVKTGSTINRFAGEFNIIDCDLKTTIDKSRFDAPGDVKEEMDKQIRSVWWVYDIFLRLSRKEAETSEGKKLNKKEQKDIDYIATHKFSENITSYHLPEEDCRVFEIPIKNEGIWKFKCEINPKQGEKKLFFKNIEEDKKELTITANTGNLFWKKIDSVTRKKDFISELVYPLTLLVGIQYLYEALGKEQDVIDAINEAVSITLNKDNGIN